jgi:phenylalanyl-tRNA synthetase beta chain
MRVPVSWLREYLPIECSPEELAQHLVSIGIEVEKIVHEVPPFSGVKVARVLTVAPHPRADRLRLATIDDGGEQKTIVCGAPNCHEGMLAAFASEGARLGIGPDGQCALEVKKATIRGVESSGMLCSEEELNIGSIGETILDFPSDFRIGEDLASKFSETILEVGLTPNLAHCLSIEGLARELSALLNMPLRNPHREERVSSIPGSWNVKVTAKEDCLSYGALIVCGKAGISSPLWMRLRLRRAGMRPVNLAVDCANYVMLSIGQPLHTFDARAFEEKQIVVERSRGGESIDLIDGRSVVLPQDVLVISNGKNPCAIAGVIGGRGSGIEETSEHIVIESAYFDPRAARRAGKKTQSSSEALRRFERGVDPNGWRRGIDLFWHLYHASMPDAKVDALVCAGREFASSKIVQCRRSQAQAVLGREVARQEMESVFARLGYESTWADTDTLSVSVPPYRHDVTEEIDLIEDIAKLSWSSTVANARPGKSLPSSHADHPLFTCEQTVRHICSSLSLQEFVTSDLISPAACSFVDETLIPKHAIISVCNPTSVDLSVLRPSLVFGLVDCLKKNISRGQTSVAAFEVGALHLRSEGKYIEKLVAGVLLSGKRYPEHFSAESPEVDFFDLKGILDACMRELGISEYAIQPSKISFFHDGRQATITCGGQYVGMLGELHPKVLLGLGISQRVYFMELDIQDVWNHVTKVAAMRPLAMYPSMIRDWTATVPMSLSYRELKDTIDRFTSSIVESVELVSVFTHPKLGEDKKNVSLRFVFRDPAKTLTQQEVDEAFVTIVQSVGLALGIFVDIGQKNETVR